MPKFTGRNLELLRTIRPHGLSLRQERKHTWVIDANGKRIISCSTTPSDRNAHKNTIKWLIKLGHLPKETKLR